MVVYLLKIHNENKHTTQANTMSIKTIEYLRKEKQEIIQVIRFCRNMRAFLFKARFTNISLQETESFIERNFPDAASGCIYCSQKELRSPHCTIPLGAPIIVLEVNEETSHIGAVGLVTNRPHLQKYRVHHENYKNTFNYIGKIRILRNEMSAEEDRVIRILEAICFNGRMHLKHGCDLNMFSPRHLWRAARIIDLVEELLNMFRKRKEKRK